MSATEIARLRAALEAARKAIISLAEQQAMPDDFWLGVVEQIDEALAAPADAGEARKSIDFVFDGPPGPDGPRFVEVEEGGVSIRLGEWIERDGGLWVLRVTPEEWDAATIVRKPT